MTTLSLGGCKIPADAVESMLQGIARVIGQVIGHIFTSSESKNTKEDPESLPFQLEADDHYQKIDATDELDAYYIVTRANGVVDHYSLDGELQWSNEEGEAEINQTTDEQIEEASGLNENELSRALSGEPMEVRTEVSSQVIEGNGQFRTITINYLIITSLAEQPINIQNVLVNRGYCKASWSVGSSSTLPHFSASTKIHLQNCETQNVREVEIQTEYDHYFFEFNVI
ncbi:hypothetical protein [Acinetobacter puyangensis]|uniref:hypothetical protein n=1 Tax=Acinetobacter puyangensis TaxID=1096779 RepID=UPI003A4D7BE6